MRKKAPRARFSLRLPFDSAIIRTHPGVHQSCFAALVKKFRHNVLDGAAKKRAFTAHELYWRQIKKAPPRHGRRKKTKRTNFVRSASKELMTRLELVTSSLPKLYILLQIVTACCILRSKSLIVQGFVQNACRSLSYLNVSCFVLFFGDRLGFCLGFCLGFLRHPEKGGMLF